MKQLRCDVCGKFISYRDIELKQAFRGLVHPDNHFAPETYETLCKQHNKVLTTSDNDVKIR